MTILSAPKNGHVSLIGQANKIIQKWGKVYVLYERGRGFLCRKFISPKNEQLMSDNKVSIVGTYTKTDKWLMIEDFDHELELQFRD